MTSTTTCYNFWKTVHPLNQTEQNMYLSYSNEFGGVYNINHQLYTDLTQPWTLAEKMYIDTGDSYIQETPMIPSGIECVTVSDIATSSTQQGGYDGLNATEMTFIFGIFLFIYSLKNWDRVFGPFTTLLSKKK